MNIRPKQYIIKAKSGVRFSNGTGADWLNQVFANYRQHILEELKKRGTLSDEYGNWLNNMQSAHSDIYHRAGGKSNTWQNQAYEDNAVGDYQLRYKGGLNNDGTIKQYDFNDTYDFNQGISPNFNTRYRIDSPPTRYSGDNSGKKFLVDNLYSAITDDRRLLGRKGDWDEQSLNQFNSELKDSGWKMALKDDGYYYLERLLPDTVVTGKTPNNPPLHDYMMKPNNDVVSKFNLAKRENEIAAQERADEEAKRNAFREKLIAGFRNIAPDALDAARLIGTLHTNNRVFDEMLKGIRPSLQQSYHTYRQVVGDEATKQTYYRRAAQGQTKAAQPFTSDADRQVAYMMEHKRVGDELRAQGDLADNQRIRETSELASQHADANRERDTTVANNNLLEINKANAAKQQLKAQKLLADWTNTDQYLLGAQSKLLQKNNERKLYDRQLAQITMQQDLLNDTILQDLQSDRDKALEAYSNDKNNPTLKKAFEDANKKYQNYMLQKKKNWNEQGLYIAKSGTKLEYKDKSDKFLYKVSKDIVDHFRRITKMTDDSRVRTLPKTVKLTPRPKAKKMQLGGVAPFYIYRPLGLGGGESTVSTQTSTSSSSSKSSSDKKSEAEKDKLDLIKELFKSVSASALPIDTSLIYKDISNTIFKAKALGEELTTDDLASMYLSSMQKLTYLKYSKDAYDKAYNQAVSNDAMDEIAVASDNSLFLQDQETGKIKKGTISDIQKSGGKLNPLTNGQLLTARAHSPNLAFNDEIFDVVNRGVGMNKIAAQIKNLASTLGSSEQKIEGISQVESNKIKNGLQILAGFDGTPDGYYKITQQTKDSQNNIQAALKYIYGMLPNNYKTIMKLHFGNENNSIKMIGNMLVSQTNSSYQESISPLTGKASSDTNGSSSSKGGGADNSAGLAFVLGQGPREIVDFNTGTSVAIRALGIRGTIQNHSQENLGQGSTLQDVSKSQFSFLKLGQATFGGSRLNPGAYSHIILNNSEIMGVDLPYKVDLNGNTVPDFQKCKLIEKADEIISQQNITDPDKINEVYQSVGLPPKYNQNGELNTQKYMRFAAIQATLDEQALQNKEAVLSDEVQLAGDVERDLYEEAMKKSNKNYSLGNGMWLTGWGKDELYKGTIFIPYDEDVAFAAVSSGRPMKQNLPDNASTVQLMQYAPKSLNYKPQDVTLSQIINN